MVTIENSDGSPEVSERAIVELRKVVREGITLAAGPAAVLLQIAHPLVGQGVSDHSTLRTRAISRAENTQLYIYCMVFGTPKERAAMKAWVDSAHAHIIGGQGANAYDAKDPNLQLWVAATIYASMVRMYELIKGPLPPARAELVYQGFSTMGTSLQVPHHMWPANLEAFGVYWSGMIKNELHVTPAARSVLDDIFRPKGLPLWARPLVAIVMPISRLITIEQLPPHIREQFGLRSTRTSRATTGLFVSGMSSIYPFIPPFIRHAQKTYSMRLMRKRMSRWGGQLNKH